MLQVDIDGSSFYHLATAIGWGLLQESTPGGRGGGRSSGFSRDLEKRTRGAPL